MNREQMYKNATHRLLVWKNMINTSERILKILYENENELKKLFFTQEELNTIKHLITIDLSGLKRDMDNVRADKQKEYYRLTELWD